MAVGHMPHLERLLKLMLGVDVQTEEMPVNFPRNGMVALHPIGDSWEEQWRLEV
jgi:phosphohistidine phosphatase SixA